MNKTSTIWTKQLIRIKIPDPDNYGSRVFLPGTMTEINISF